MQGRCRSGEQALCGPRSEASPASPSWMSAVLMRALLLREGAKTAAALARRSWVAVRESLVRDLARRRHLSQRP